ncbi:MAG: diadenylate cyclase CdaA [Treponema sp.]|nr:diadenylate cyclase CdaA [Treponema sp.]
MIAFQKLYGYISPVLDICILAFLLFKAYELISRTNGVQIVTAAIILGLIYAIAYILHLETINWILGKITGVLFISVAIVFQPELRKIFLRLGQNGWFNFGERLKHTPVDSVLLAAETLSKLRRGMLVVFPRRVKIEEKLTAPGTKLNADVSSSILLTIFKFDTPLHDGACIIQGGKVTEAGCFLPLSEQYDIKKTFGTRHRAALGLSEVCDAVVLVVSEETGAITLAYDSILHYDLPLPELKMTLESLLEIKPEDKKIEDTIDEHTTIVRESNR